MQQTARLSRDDEARLAALAHAGDDAARSVLILSMQRYVARLAYKYPAEYRDDVAQEAMLAVIKVVDQFDPTRASLVGACFWPIVRAVQEFHARNRAIRLPNRVRWVMLRASRTRAELSQLLGRSPYVDEVQALLSAQCPSAHPSEIEAAAAGDFRYFGIENARHIAGTEDPEADLLKRIYMEKVAGWILAQLSDAQAEGVRRRFGVGGATPHDKRDRIGSDRAAKGLKALRAIAKKQGIAA